MNYNQHFDEHIKDQFLDYTPEVHPRIWENIAREREKKRPAGFWFSLFNQRNILMGTALLLALGGGAYVLLQKNAPSTTGNTVTTAERAAQPATNDNNGGKIIPFENNNTNNTAAPVSNTNADAAALTNTGNDNSTAGTTTNNIAASGNDGENFSAAAAEKKYSNTARLRVSYKNGTAADYFADETGVDYKLPFLLYTAQKNTSPKTEASLQQRKMQNVILPGCPSIEKNTAGNKTYFEVYGGPDMAFRNLSDTGNSAYLQKRKESTKFASAFSAGLRYTKVFSNGMSIRTGINYSQINEKFQYSEGNIIQVVYIINAAGDTIGSYTTTGTRYKTTHNRFRTVDVPIMVGYEMGNGRLHANLNAGIMVNIYSWQRGEVLDNSLQPVNITTGKSNSPYQFKTNVGMGFMGGISLYYKMNEKLHLLAEPYFRYSLTPASKETITLKQKYNTAGLRLGLRLDLH